MHYALARPKFYGVLSVMHYGLVFYGDNGVLRPKLLNNPFACCSLINFDFLPPHMAHFDKIIALFIYNNNIFMRLFDHFLYLNHLYSLHF